MAEFRVSAADVLAKQPHRAAKVEVPLHSVGLHSLVHAVSGDALLRMPASPDRFLPQSLPSSGRNAARTGRFLYGFYVGPLKAVKSRTHLPNTTAVTLVTPTAVGAALRSALHCGRSGVLAGSPCAPKGNAVKYFHAAEQDM